MTSQFKVGARVKVKPECAETFIQPWRGRFSKARAGTIVQEPSVNVPGWLVEWDHGKVKYPDEWRLVMRASELTLVEEAPK